MKWNNLHSFYTSDEWKRLKQELVLERVDNKGVLICEYCHKPMYKNYEIIGHHKKELTPQNVNDYYISLNKDNIMLVHHVCHNKIHERFGAKIKKVYLVWGSPLSGKSTFVKENANADDFVVDMDSIWESISNSKRYDKPNRLKVNAFGIRDCQLDMVRMRVGDWRNAWVIMSAPLKMERERFKRIYGAESIHINTCKEECINRSIERPDVYKRYIDEYFTKYQSDE